MSLLRDDIIRGLREFADWLEEHPDVRVDTIGIGSTVYGATRDQVVAAARAGRKFDKHFYGGTFMGTVAFPGGVTYSVSSSREAVCTKRVVGRETVMVPDPSAPKIAEERDVVEWDCEPILGQVSE